MCGWCKTDKKRKFKNNTVLISRADPKMIVTVPESELNNYTEGTEIFFNYSILKTNGNKYYLLDYDILRPSPAKKLSAR